MVTFGWSDMTWRQWGRLTAQGWGRWPVALRFGGCVRPGGKVRGRIAINCVLLSAGDPDEWCRLVAHCHDRLVGHALRVVGNVHDADDVVQNLFVRLWLCRSRLAAVLNLDGYLAVAVRHKALNQIRNRSGANGRAVLLANVDSLPCHRTWGPAYRVETGEKQEVLTRLAGLLTPAQLLVYRQVEQDPAATSRAIAGRIGCSHRNVLAILGRIRRTFGGAKAVATSSSDGRRPQTATVSLPQGGPERDVP